MDVANVVENCEISLADKMKPKSAHDKFKESVSSDPFDLQSSTSSDQGKSTEKEVGIPSADEEPQMVPEPTKNVINPMGKSVEISQDYIDSLKENAISKACPSLISMKEDTGKLDKDEAKGEISTAKEPILMPLPTVESTQQQNVNQTISDITRNMKEHPINIQNETNSKENCIEECVKSPTEAEQQNGVKESTAPKDGTSNLKSKVYIDTDKSVIEDPQMTGGTSKESSLSQDQKKGKASKNNKLKAAQNQLFKEALAMVPKEKMKEMQEFIDGIQAIESSSGNLGKDEEERMKSWRTLLADVTSVSTFGASSYNRSSPSSSVIVAILQRSAKQQYKRKMGILRENVQYRMGLLKQLKHSIKNNYKSEAQQLYFDYTSIKNKTQNTRNLNKIGIHLDFQESKVIVSSENPKDIAALS